MLAYIEETYGEEYVCQISTISLHKARAAIKSVATALGVDFGKANHLSSLIVDADAPLKEILHISEISDMYKKDAEIRRVIDIAIQIQNNPRHIGVHAAGIIISPVPVTNVCPVRKDKGRIITQWHMDHTEAIGFLKVDILGLTTLDVIDNTIKAIKENRGIDIDLDNIPLDDSKVYDLLSQGDTNGVFQLESNLAKNYLRKMWPKNFTDIVNFVALIRPGPLDAPAPSGDGTMVDEFIRRLHGQSKIIPPHPLIRDVLEDTFQICVYQESVMQITQVMAGFSESEADSFRRIIGSKRVEDIPDAKKRFLEGCTQKGIIEEDALYVFSLLETFSEYGLN